MVIQNLDSAQSLNELILKIEVLKDTFGTFVAIKPLHMAFFRNRYNWVAFELSSSKKVCKDDSLGVSVYTGFTKTTFEEIISKIKGLKPNNFSTQVEVLEAPVQPLAQPPVQPVAEPVVQSSILTGNCENEFAGIF